MNRQVAAQVGQQCQADASASFSELLHRRSAPCRTPDDRLFQRTALDRTPEFGPTQRRESVLHVFGTQVDHQLRRPRTEAVGLSAAHGSPPDFAHDFSRVPVHAGAPLPVQAQLRASSPWDEYEQEANEIAYRIGRVPPPGVTSESNLSIPRAQEARGQHAGQPLRTRRVRIENGVEPVASARVGNLLRSRGTPLDSDSRTYFEANLGHDFSKVRIHADARAAAAAHDVGAKAFTVGPNIVFGAGQYDPSGAKGRQLMAHELTHVLQQRAVDPVGSASTPEPLSATILQRDFAVAPPNLGAVPIVLTAAEIQEAIEFNNLQFFGSIEIEQMRDVLGIPPSPSVIDADFVNAVVGYQAQNNLTQDGKLGPVTAARLSTEFRAEARFLGREGRELRRQSRRLDLRSFTITVTRAATELTNTGSAEYAVQWGVPDPQANGWIIQHVTWAVNKEDSAGAAQAANNPDGLDFWEGWEVRGGNVFIGSSASPHSADTFRSIDEGAGTRGTVTVTGRVTFMPDFNLTEPPWGHTVPAAGGLPTLTVAPLGWSDGFARLHRMLVAWDDTVAPATHSVATTP